MIPSGLFPSLVSSVVLIASAMGISTCATANTVSDPVDAVLLNPQDGPTRQAIRVFVRESSGPDLITSPESLAISPELVNHRRDIRDTRFRSASSARQFKPVGTYRLLIDNNNRCLLMHTAGDMRSYIELPASANCAVYRPG